MSNVALALALVTLVVLTGCDGGPKATSLPSSSPQHAPSASPSSGPPPGLSVLAASDVGWMRMNRAPTSYMMQSYLVPQLVPATHNVDDGIGCTMWIREEDLDGPRSQRRTP
jgi:hypothetical protein